MDRNWGLAAAMGLFMALDDGAKAAAQSTQSPPSIDGEVVMGVIKRIKEDVAYYFAGENQGKKIPMVSVLKDSRCPMQYFDFNIDKVKVELNGVQADVVNGMLGLTIPFGLVKTLGPGLDIKGSRVTTNSQILTIDLFPVSDPSFVLPKQLMDAKPDPALPDDFKPRTALVPMPGPSARLTPISDTLIALRNDLTLAAASKPCLETLSRNGLPLSDEIKMEFRVETDVNKDVGFHLVIGSIKYESDRKDTAANTLTISFSPTTSPGKPRDESKPRK